MFRRLFLTLIVLSALSAIASAQVIPWVASLRLVAYSLGWLMMAIMGMKWIVAESANDRADAKKGMIYIVIGLVLVANACQLLCLYCCTAQQSVPGFTCDVSPYCATGCTCP